MSATRRRDLRTGTTPWRSSGRARLEGRRLPSNTHCDVAVVGAGISGALIADALLSEGLDVVMLDRRGAARGSTPASTALIQYELDMPLGMMRRRLGVEAAQRIWMRSRLALAALEERIAELGIAGVSQRDSLYLSGTLLGDAALEREAVLRRETGFTCQWLTRREVQRRYGVPRRSGLLSHGNLAANPLTLTLALLGSGRRRGLRLHTPSEVVHVEAAARSVELYTDAGARLRAGHVVFATGYEQPKMVPKKGQQIISTWAIATAPQRSRLWPTQCHMWEAGSPYLYMRCDPRGRIICGGEDEPFSDEQDRDRLLAQKTRILQRKLAALLPGVDSRAEFAWTACFGSSAFGLPTIAPVPSHTRCLVAMGYGGNGITFSMLAAQLVRSHILGQGDPDAALFAFRGSAKRS
jgi:glycine/D-amino acid oxidase-like deaminating enzyme